MASNAWRGSRNGSRPDHLSRRGSARALFGDEAVVGAKQRRFETRVGGHVSVKRARKKHLGVEAHAVHVGQPRRWIGEGHAADRTVLALNVSAELAEDIARRIGLLRARPERVGLQRTLDQPARVEISQPRVIVDRHRAGTPGAIRFRQILPHERIDRAMRVGVENTVTLKHYLSLPFDWCVE